MRSRSTCHPRPLSGRAATLLGPGVLLLASLSFPAAPAASQVRLDPRIQAAVSEISEERLEALLTRLVGFGTRNTMSALMDTTGYGIDAAAEWMAEEFRSYSPRLQVSFDEYRVAPQGRITEEVRLRNVMAVLPGRSPRRIYVTGHYDSLARLALEGGFNWGQFGHPAPGANDDGSGTVLAMEVGRVLAQSGIEFDATLVFMPLAGEEQGLVGARLHAQRAAREGIPIQAVFNNDIIGNSRGGNGIVDSRTVRIFSEGPEDSPSRHMARYIRRTSSPYVPGHEIRLIAREDRFGRGGDHTAFNQLGFTAVRFTESRENYFKQHNLDDTLDGLDWAYLARNARVNLASVATMALAPPAPDVDGNAGPMLTRGEGYDAFLRWNRSPGAVAYRVVWRDGWSLDWQHEVVVGDVTEHTLPNMSIDDFIYGVAAIGPDGHESMVTPYIRPPRADVEIREVGRD
jgi:hypothetical protein